MLSEEAQSKRRRARSRLEQARARWRTWLGCELLTTADKAGAVPRGRRAFTHSLLPFLQPRWNLGLGLTECL
jgi:hypothetical protein